MLLKSAYFTSGHVARRLKSLESGNISSLFNDWRSGHLVRAGGKSKGVSNFSTVTRSNEKIRAAAMSALAEGYPGTALRRLDPKPILEPAAAYNPLLALHPAEQEYDYNLTTAQRKVTIEPDAAVKVLLKMPSISAPGPSGLRASHLKPLLQGLHDNRPLAQVLTLIANGEGPNWLRNARLIAIAKHNGGLRPIAIGETLRRLAASSLNEQFIRRKESIPENQLCMIKDGAIVGATIMSASLAKGESVAALDSTNAFNSLSRDALLHSVKGSILERYAVWAYSKHSDLLLNDEFTIRSQSGVQQGDPLGMTLFSIAIAEPLASARNQFHNLKIIAYADDIFLIGNTQDIEKCVSFLKQELNKIGLKLNSSDSWICCLYS